MDIANRIDLTALAESYMFANTPAYLYKHFRENASLKELSEQIKLQTLIEEYARRTASGAKAIEDTVIAYAVLIAFTFLQPDNAEKGFNSVNLALLDWGNEIQSIFRSTVKSVSILTTMFKPSGSIRTEPERASSSTTVFTPSPKPLRPPRVTSSSSSQNIDLKLTNGGTQ